MDIPRQPVRRNRPMIIVGIAAALVVTTLGLSRLKPAAPSVERSTLLIDTVKRGRMLREVRGTGALEPENQRIVSAMTAGRVDRVFVRPGTAVEAKTVLLEMSNPDVQLQSLDAERQVKLAEADLASLEASLDGQRLVAASSAAAARTALHDAQRQEKVAVRLASEGLASGMEIERARDQAAEALTRYESEQSRLEVLTRSLKAQLSLRRSEIDRLKAISRFQTERVTSMRVMAGAAGVVQELALDPGQWVNPGQLLARVAGQDRLKAVVRVPETQVRDVAIGLKALIDTRNGTVAARVSRVDPGAQNGTVEVDLAIEGVLPKGARPDLSVDATIEIERLDDVVYVGRPADGSSEATVGLFRLTADGHFAERIPVKLGRGSVSAIEVLSGLKPGDQVVLSEMSRWDGVSRVRLK